MREETREIPVLDEVDVLVAGGGVAGCAAAVSAARAGARTLLLERNGCLGGVATASLMANIGNSYLLAGGDQIIHGFSAELVDRLVQAGAASPHWRHRDVPGVVLDSERLKVVLADILQEAGVEVLTHALAARPVTEGPAVRGLFFESKSGRQALRARAVIDATGEADIAYQAGARCRVSDTWKSASILFKLANVDVDAFVTYLRENPEGFPAGHDSVRDLETFERNWRERGILFFPHGGGAMLPLVKQAMEEGHFVKEIPPAAAMESLGMYALRGTDLVVVNSNFYTIENLDIRCLSAFELHAQKMCYHVADFLIQRVPGFSRACVAHVGVDLGIRVSRIIEGRGTLDAAVIEAAKAAVRSDDVTGTAPVPVTQPGSPEPVRDFTFDVPFGVTVPVGCDNLLVASGKSVSTTEPILRGMARCMVCGQATGAASALAARAGVPSAEVPIRELQRELLRQGVFLGGPERLRQLGLA